MAEAQKTGLLAEHKVDTKSVNLPNGWEDSTFVPYDFGYFAFVYNKESSPILQRVSKSWWNLAMT